MIELRPSKVIELLYKDLAAPFAANDWLSIAANAQKIINEAREKVTLIKLIFVESDLRDEARDTPIAHLHLYDFKIVSWSVVAYFELIVYRPPWTNEDEPEPKDLILKNRSGFLGFVSPAYPAPLNMRRMTK